MTDDFNKIPHEEALFLLRVMYVKLTNIMEAVYGVHVYYIDQTLNSIYTIFKHDIETILERDDFGGLAKAYPFLHESLIGDAEEMDCWEFMSKDVYNYLGIIEKEYILTNNCEHELPGYYVEMLNEVDKLCDAHKRKAQSYFQAMIAKVEADRDARQNGKVISTNKYAMADIKSLIYKGECDVAEFKSSMRWDYREHRVNKELEAEIVRAVAGFMNSEQGGTLLIGVDDSGNCCGLQHDYSSLGGRKNRDAYQLSLTDLLIRSCGKEHVGSIRISFECIDNKDVCRVDIAPSDSPIFVSSQNEECFYLRIGNSTRRLTARELLAYSRKRWPNSTMS